MDKLNEMAQNAIKTRMEETTRLEAIKQITLSQEDKDSLYSEDLVRLVLYKPKKPDTFDENIKNILGEALDKIALLYVPCNRLGGKKEWTIQNLAN